MFSKIDNKAKLNAFSPVRVPKVKDIFKRMGYRSIPSSSDGQVADFSRNPLSSFDSDSRKFDEYVYQQYAEQMKREAEEQNAKSDKEEESTSDE